ncbi:MAG TPA: TonB family protein [Polyangia bacterium]
MTYAGRLGICAVASVASHLLLARGSAHLPPRVEAAPAVVLRVELRQAPEEPEPEAAPEEKAPEPTKQPPHEVPTRRSRKVTTDVPRQVNAPREVVPTEKPATTDSPFGTPVFGISMESTSAAGNGPAMAVGNTLLARPRGRPGETDANAIKPLMAPVQAYEVTKMPLPKGECTGHYTDEAREAGLEGVVVFDLVVDERGHTRDITVVQGLGSGLTEAARRALQTCVFTPGERDGRAVPVRVRSFKIRFRLRENE